MEPGLGIAGVVISGLSLVVGAVGLGIKFGIIRPVAPSGKWLRRVAVGPVNWMIARGQWVTGGSARVQGLKMGIVLGLAVAGIVAGVVLAVMFLRPPEEAVRILSPSEGDEVPHENTVQVKARAMIEGEFLVILVRPRPPEPGYDYFVQEVAWRVDGHRWEGRPVYVGAPDDPPGMLFKICAVITQSKVTPGESLERLPAGDSDCVLVTRATGTPSPTPSATAEPPSVTATPVTRTPTASATAEPLTATATPVPHTPVPSATAEPPSATATPVPHTPVPSATAEPPSATATPVPHTPVPSPTAEPRRATATPVSDTLTPSATAEPPSPTPGAPRPRIIEPREGDAVPSVTRMVVELEPPELGDLHLYFLVRPIPTDSGQYNWVQETPVSIGEGRWASDRVCVGLETDPSGLPFALCALVTHETLSVRQGLHDWELPEGPMHCINVTRQ